MAKLWWKTEGYCGDPVLPWLDCPGVFGLSDMRSPGRCDRGCAGSIFVVAAHGDTACIRRID